MNKMVVLNSQVVMNSDQQDHPHKSKWILDSSKLLMLLFNFHGIELPIENSKHKIQCFICFICKPVAVFV